MSEQTPREGGTGWVKIGGLAILAAVAVFGIIRLSQGSEGGKLEITPGGVTFTQNARDSFADLLGKAIDTDAGDVNALLESKGYYKLTSTDWVNELRQKKLDASVGLQLRQLLYDLAGPFAPDVALDGADGRLLVAVARLKEKAETFEPADQREANRFLAAILRDSLEQRGVFDVTFNAEVALLNMPDPGLVAIFVCRNSVLAGKEIILLYNRDDGFSNTLSGVTRRDDAVFNCAGTRTLEKLLARQPARIGLSRAAFERLYGPVEEGATLPPRLAASLQARPLHLSATVTVE